MKGINKEKITQTPEDGFVSNSIMEPYNQDSYGKYHKGYRTTIKYEIDDPSFTRPFAYGLCAFFFLIGIFLLLFHLWIMSIPFIVMSLLGLLIAKRNIDAVAENKKKVQEVTIDLKKQNEQLNKELLESIGDGFEELKSNTFTKENYKYFRKTAIIVYLIISFILFMLISIFINFIFGIITLLLLVVIMIIYFSIISKLFK